MHAYSKDPTRLAALAAPAPYASLKAALAWLCSSWLGNSVTALVVEREARIAIDELRGWDDHMLRDIGLERMDIEGAVRGQFRPLPRDADRLGAGGARKPLHPYR
jgi:uncharacterized protein YjiS (DUF1127 family)